MKKGQTLLFKTINRAGQEIVTTSLELAVMVSKEGVDPSPCNRKTRRAMPKLIKKLLKQ